MSSTPVQEYAVLNEVKFKLNISTSDTSQDVQITVATNDSNNYIAEQTAVHATVVVAGNDPSLSSMANNLAAAYFNFWLSTEKDREELERWQNRIQQYIMAKYGKKSANMLSGEETIGVTTGFVSVSGGVSTSALESPLTTKGDIWGYAGTDARIPVGTNGLILTADSSEGLGVSWQVAGGGLGDVIGPDGATNNAIARYNTGTGKLIQNSGVIIDDFNNVTGVLSIAIGNGTWVISEDVSDELLFTSPTGDGSHGIKVVSDTGEILLQNTVSTNDYTAILSTGFTDASSSTTAIAFSIQSNITTASDSGTEPITQIQGKANGGTVGTRPIIAFYNFNTKLLQLDSDGTADFQGNTITNAVFQANLPDGFIYVGDENNALAEIPTGLETKANCRVATTTSNINLASATDPNPIDGITLSTNQRILLKNQINASENGIYNTGVSGTNPTDWNRATDANTSIEVNNGMFTLITEGTLNANTAFVLSTPDSIILDTTDLTFDEFSFTDIAHLNFAQTFTDINTFGRIGDVGKLAIAGTTSGITVLDATAVASGTLTLPAATDVLVARDTTDTLTNKTLTTPIIGDFTQATHDHEAAAGGDTLTATNALDATGTTDSTTFLRGDNTWAVPPTGSSGITTLNSDTAAVQTLTGGTGIDITDSTPDHSFAIDSTVVTLIGSQILTNKTIDGDNNTILDINETQMNVSVGVAGTVLTSNGVGSPPSYQTGGTSLPVPDTTSIVEGSADATKELRFDVGSNTTGVIGVIATAFTTAKTMTFPDATDTVVGKATTDTFTNKTIDADGTGNVITNIGSTEIKSEIITGFTTVTAASGDFVLLSDTGDSGNLKKVNVVDFLGGVTPPFADTTSIVEGSADATKELRFDVGSNTTGIIGVIATAFTTAKTMTFPDATDTVVGKATTDTFTNKTIDADGTGNVITNIGSTEIKSEIITGFVTVSAASGDFVLLSDTGDSGNLKKVNVVDFLGGSAPPFDDATALVSGSADATKLLRFEVDGQTTGITGVFATTFTTAKILTFPDATDTVVGKATTDTFTNKTIDADGTGNVITNIGSTEIKSEIITGFTTVTAASGDFVLLSDTSDSGNLKKVNVVDFLGAASQTPWLTNIDADGFDLQDLSNIEFRTTTGAPAGTVQAIYADTDGIIINVPTGDDLSILVNGGTPEYTFDVADANFFTNTLRLTEITTPVTSLTNEIQIYAKEDGDTLTKLFYRQSDGTEVRVGFPLNLPELNVGSSTGTVIIDFRDTTRHARKYLATGDITFDFTNLPSGQYAIADIIVTQDGTGNHAVFLPVGTINKAEVEAGVNLGAGEDTYILIKFFDGITYAFLQGSDIFPINFPEQTATTATISQTLTFLGNTRHAQKYTLDQALTTFSFAGTTGNTTEYIDLLLVQDGSGNRAIAFPGGTVNAAQVVAGLDQTALAETSILVKFHYGTFYVFLQGGEALPVPDTTAIVEGSDDATKLLRFEVDGFTTATTRVITPPDADITLVNTSDGTISNTNVNASAAIDYSKLATLSSTNILVGSAGNVATSVSMTGDIAISNTGVTSIASDVIVNADVNSAAAIAYSKLATLATGNILFGNAGVPTVGAMSGDATIDNTGAVTVSIASTDLSDSANLARVTTSNTFGDFLQTFTDNAITIQSPDTLTPTTIVNAQQTLARNLTIPILTANRNIVVTGESSQITIGTEVTGASTALTDSGNLARITTANVFGSGLTQTFTHSSTATGLRLIPVAGDVTTSPLDGSIIYNSTSGTFRFRQASAWLELGGSSTKQTINKSTAQSYTAADAETTISDMVITMPNRAGRQALVTFYPRINPGSAGDEIRFFIRDDGPTLLVDQVDATGQAGETTSHPITIAVECVGQVITMSYQTNGVTSGTGTFITTITDASGASRIVSMEM